MAETVTIGRMQVRASGDHEPLALRLRLSHLMTTAEFQPVGIPPQATLLIRQVTMNSPLNVEGWRVSQMWQEDLRETMARFYRSAVRPRNGIVPFDAEAVLFEEQAELIAALSRMSVEPTSEAIWVWHSATNSTDAPNTERLFRLWQESPRLVPAVLARLEKWQVADAVLARFSESMQVRICHDMLAEWETSTSPEELRTLTQILSYNEMHPSGISRFESGRKQEAENRNNTISFLLSYAFVQTIAESAPTIRVMRTLAFLHRTSVSQSQLQQKFRALVEAAQKQQTEQNQAQPTTQKQTHTEESLSASRSETTPLQTSNITEMEQAAILQAKQIELTAPVSSYESGGNKTKTQSETVTSDVPLENDRDLQTAPKLWNGLEGIETHFGGVFYLLNVIINSDALASLDADEENEQSPAIWRVLEAFAQSLLTEADIPFENDALWQILAQWDQREENATPEISGQDETLSKICRLLRSELKARLRWDETEFQENIVSLISVPATVYATSVHVDVVFPLHRIDMTARIAGLDASPGWVAEILRVVLFHFE